MTNLQKQNQKMLAELNQKMLAEVAHMMSFSAGIIKTGD